MPQKKETYIHDQSRPPTPDDANLRSEMISIVAELMSSYNTSVVLNGNFFLKDLPANPATGRQGQLASVNGKLKIYVSGSGWVTVGTQT